MMPQGRVHVGVDAAPGRTVQARQPAGVCGKRHFVVDEIPASPGAVCSTASRVDRPPRRRPGSRSGLSVTSDGSIGQASLTDSNRRGQGQTASANSLRRGATVGVTAFLASSGALACCGGMSRQHYASSLHLSACLVPASTGIPSATSKPCLTENGPFAGNQKYPKSCLDSTPSFETTNARTFSRRLPVSAWPQAVFSSRREAVASLPGEHHEVCV